jgi:hypothetical protein
VVQREGRRLRGQGAGPPGEVIDQGAGDPGAGQGLDRLQVPGELRALVAQRGQQRQPAVREPGQGGLAAAAGQVEGLGGAGGSDPPSPGQPAMRRWRRTAVRGVPVEGYPAG